MHTAPIQLHQVTYICELWDATDIFKVRLLLFSIIHQKKINTKWYKALLTSQTHRQQAGDILTTLLHHLCQVETSFFVVVSKATCHVASTWLSAYCSTLHTLCSMLCKQFPHVLYIFELLYASSTSWYVLCEGVVLFEPKLLQLSDDLGTKRSDEVAHCRLS